MRNRIPYGKEKYGRSMTRQKFIQEYGECHDCGAKYGEIHEYGCDMERCPVCGGQFMSCKENCISKIAPEQRKYIKKDMYESIKEDGKDLVRGIVSGLGVRKGKKRKEESLTDIIDDAGSNLIGGFSKGLGLRKNE